VLAQNVDRVSLGQCVLKIAEIEEAHNLDPLSPIITANHGLYSYYQHKYDAAIEIYKQGLKSDPDFWVARHYLALAYVQKGMYNEAIAELRGLIKAPPTGPIPDKVIETEMEASSSLGFAYGMAGKTAEARDMLEKLQALSQRRYISGIYFAIVYAGLKDNERVISYLNEAFHSRQPGLVLIRIDPMFDGLRSDPKFQELTRRFEPIP